MLRLCHDARCQFGPRMQGILSFNDETTVGIASALQADFAPEIVSINASRAGVDLVRAGTVAATWSLVPASTGTCSPGPRRRWPPGGTCPT